jgi:DNA-binding winged helix-turn-helix (wHTH) protein/tetratricopeptide (TPR) repeat protein
VGKTHPELSPRAYRFGPYELEVAGELRKFGRRVRLQKKPFQLLLTLVEQRGQIVTRADLQARLWPGTFVDFEQNLNIAVKKVRDALCDEADSPSYVETIPGLGYRFIAAATPDCTPPPARGFRTAAGNRKVWAAGAVLSLAFAFLIWESWRSLSSPLHFEAHDFVLVGDFENYTGEPLLNGVLETALRRELSNSPFVSVAPGARVEDTLRLMGKPVSTHIDPAVGREICLRDGAIKAVLTGRVQKVGSTYQMDVFVINPVSGATVAAFDQTVAGEDDFLRGVRHLADSVRRRLGEDVGAVTTSREKLEQVTTPSLEALRLYSQGERSAEQSRWPEAEQLFRRALARDPQFASALNMLAWSLANQPGDHKAERLALTEQANQLAAHASEREAGFIRGTYYYFRGDLDKAVAAYRAVATVYPDDYWAANNAFLLEMSQGHEAEALAWGQRIADLRPNGPRINSAVWGAALNLGREDVARRYGVRLRVLQQAGLLPPATNVMLAWEPAVRRAGAGDTAGALAEAQKVLTEAQVGRLDRHLVIMRAVFLFSALRRFHQAESLADELTGIDRYFALQRIAVERADAKKLVEVTRKIQREFPDRQDAAFYAATDLAYLGRTTEARAAIQRLSGYSPSRSNWGVDLLEGNLQAAEKRWRVAIARLQSALGHARVGGLRSQGFFTADSLARVLDASGDTAAAIRVLEPLQRDPRFDFYLACGPTPQRFLLARLYRKSGRIDEARKVESELLALLQSADADDPLLIALKREGRR